MGESARDRETGDEDGCLLAAIVIFPVLAATTACEVLWAHRRVVLPAVLSLLAVAALAWWWEFGT